MTVFCTQDNMVAPQQTPDVCMHMEDGFNVCLYDSDFVNREIMLN